MVPLALHEVSDGKQHVSLKSFSAIQSSQLQTGFVSINGIEAIAIDAVWNDLDLLWWQAEFERLLTQRFGHGKHPSRPPKRPQYLPPSSGVFRKDIHLVPAQGDRDRFSNCRTQNDAGNTIRKCQITLYDIDLLRSAQDMREQAKGEKYRIKGFQISGNGEETRILDFYPIDPVRRRNPSSEPVSAEKAGAREVSYRSDHGNRGYLGQRFQSFEYEHPEIGHRPVRKQGTNRQNSHVAPFVRAIISRGEPIPYQVI
ncbi:hypothetical protein GCM10010836_24660 [Aminobacter aminovorans]